MSKTKNYGWDDASPDSANYINPVVISIVATYKPQNILDVGCGNGTLAGQLSRLGYAVSGVDGDEKGIEIATSRHPGASFSVVSFADSTIGTFDMVCSTEVVEHLYSPHELATYCFSSLRPGGTLVMTTPYHGFLKNLAISLVNGWDKHHTANWHGGHIKFWSRATLSQLLEDAGFEIVGFRGVGRLPLLWKSMILVARRPNTSAGKA